MQKAWPALALSVAVLVLGGCSTYFRDRASDYHSAKDAPPLQFPANQETRAIKPLYPIPPGADVVAEPGKKFEVPKPKPLAVLPSDAAAPVQPQVLKQPVLTQDGNGHPLISIEGEFNPVWDRLDESLRQAGVKIDDRDQRVGIYYLSLPDADGKPAPFQLRLSRGQTAYSLTLQKDDDTLAPQATTKTLFESIVSHWPKDSGDMNGKARPAVYR